MSHPRPAFAPFASCSTSALPKRPRAPCSHAVRFHARPTPLLRAITPSSLKWRPTPAKYQPPNIKASADRPDTSTHIPASTAAPAPIGPNAAQEPPLDARLTFWLAALTEACAALFAIGLCSISGLPVLGKGWTFSVDLLGQAVLATVPFSAVFWTLERAPTGVQAATEANFKAFFGKRTIWEVGVFCVCVAFGEELLFRSWLLAGLEAWQLPPHVALVSSSVVFGVLHAYTKVYMILASLAGLMFGGMFLSSGQSVLEPLVVHFLYDFCTILVMQRKWLTGDET